MNPCAALHALLPPCGERAGRVLDGRVLVFEMLAGVRPYSANTAYEWIILHMNATPPSLADYGVGPQLARVVKRMLSGRPELRQQTMREVIQDLRTASRGLKNVHAFAAEGAPVAAGSGLTTDILSAPAGVPVHSTPVPAPPSMSYQPPAVATPQPSPQSQQPSQQPIQQQSQYQSQQPSQQPSYQPPPAPAPQPSYQNQPPSYPQPSYQNPQTQYPQPYQPPAYPSNQPPPGQHSRLRRLAEFSFGALVIVVYLIFNWSETVGFFHRFLDSLKFKGSP